MKCYIQFIIVLLLAQALTVGQGVLQVPGAGFSTIQSAINAAQNGDVVEVLPGTYIENLLIADKDIELRAQTRGTVIIDGGGLGPCLKVERSSGSLVDGLELTNGFGGQRPFTGGVGTYGGGIFIDGLDPGPPFSLPGAHLTVRFCKIQGNAAENGAGVYCDAACDLTLEDCEVFNNQSTYRAGVLGENGTMTIHRSRFFGNGPGQGGVDHYGGYLEMTDSSVTGSPYSALVVKIAKLSRCRIEGNDQAIGIPPANAYPWPTGIELYDCLITGNGHASMTGAHIDLSRNSVISNCTIVDNLNPPGVPMIQCGDWNQVTITNSIIRNNGGPDLNVIPPAPGHPWIGLVPLGAITATNSCFSQPESGFGNHALDPLFVDPAGGDYRLKPGSPCIDAGDGSHSFTGSLDLARGTRNLLDDVDMGCYEARRLAHHHRSAGRVGQNVGGPYEILEINGSTGGLFRTVTVPIGTASSVSMAQPPNLTAPANFVIFGFLGEAGVETALPVPLGIGEMMFAPQPMVPAFLHWLFFTYTDNFNPGAPQLTPSTATPWSSGLGPAIPFPLTLTLQGVIEEAPGAYVPTNAILFEVQ